QTAKSPCFQKNGAGVRKCDSISEGREQDRAPSMAVVQNYPQKRSGGTFLTKQFLYGFVHIIQLSILFRQTEPSIVMN
ncbi:MAG: hypothetical protein J6K92_01735, partial [Oscillospiraceae bacterium]|nr:hypothetical protein [Oscillospiraceae bacterium]